MKKLRFTKKIITTTMTATTGKIKQSIKIVAGCLALLASMSLNLKAQPDSSGLAFNGDAFAEVANHPEINISGKNITIEFWMKHDGTSNKDAFIIGNQADKNKQGYLVRLVGKNAEPKIKFEPSTGNYNPHVTSNRGLEKNRWYHIAVVLSNGNPIMYINGKKEVSKTADSDLGTNDLPLVIGSDADKQGNYFHGSLDEVRIWNKALSGLKIEANMTTELAGNESGLAAYFKMNQTSGSSIKNQVTNNDGSLTGNYSLSYPGALPVTPVDLHSKPDYASQSVQLYWSHPDYASAQVSQYNIYRKYKNENRKKIATVSSGNTSYTDNTVNKDSLYYYEVTLTTNSGIESDFSNPAHARITSQTGLKFSGNGYIKISKTRSLRAIEENIEMAFDFWMKHDGTSDKDAFILGNKASAAQNGYAVKLVEAKDETQIEFVPGSGKYNPHLISKQGLEKNRWYHIVVLYKNNEKLKLYINGKEEVSKSSNGKADLKKSLPLIIGSNAQKNGNYFHGEIDELRIWNTSSLNPSTLMNKKMKGNETGLIGYYRFTEEEGSGKIKSSARPMPGTLNGDVSFASKGSRPAAPVNVHARPHKGDIELYFDSPSYLKSGFSNYSIYRKSENTSWQKMADLASQDTMFTDESAKDSVMYEYYLTLTDTNGRESDSSQKTHATSYPFLAGRALKLSGNNSYAEFSKTPSLRNIEADKKMTIDFWLKINNSSEENPFLVSNKEKKKGNGYAVKLKTKNNKKYIEYAPGSGNYNNHLVSDSSLKLNKWYHVTIFYNSGENMEIFINGKNNGKASSNGKGSIQKDLPLVLGSNAQKNGNFFSGAIDELRIWNTTSLTPENLMKDHRIGNEKGLVGYWRFNEGEGNNVRSSARPLDGALTNASFINSPIYGREAPQKIMLQVPTDSAVLVDKQPHFRWFTRELAFNYQLQLSSDSNFTSFVLDTTLKDTSLKFTKSLDKGSKYFWRVRGVSQNDDAGEWSEKRSFKKEVLPVPEMVSLISPDDKDEGTSLKPAFLWSQADKAESYHLQVSQDKNFDSLIINKHSYKNKLYMNDGSGSFANAEAGLKGNINGDIALGDLNGDNFIDIVSTGKLKTRVYMNDGSGNYEQANTGIPGVNNGSVALGDLNGDNFLDIVITNDKKTMVYKYEGPSKYTKVNNKLKGVSQGNVELGDLNGDSHLDILMAGDHQTIAYKNDGSAGFTMMDASLSGLAGGSVALGDLNGDNHLDPVLMGKKKTIVYQNDGSGNFNMIETGLPGISNGAIALGELNGDNNIDIAATGSGKTVVYFNNGNGNFSIGDNQLIGISDGDIALGDLNGDNHLDISLTGNGQTKSYKNDGSGNFSSFDAGFTGLYNGSIALADLNKDQSQDIVVMGKNMDSRMVNTGYQVEDSLYADSTYFWRVRGISQHGVTGPWSETREFETSQISAIAQYHGKNNGFVLKQNQPNPFSNQTQIVYELPESAMVKVQVYNLMGDQVDLLVNEKQSPGKHKVRFDASGLPAGIYFYHLKADDTVITQKMNIVK